MSFLGSIGKTISKVVGGAIGGFLGSGFNPIGAIVGGIGGLFTRGSGGDSFSFQYYIPPYAQQGASILQQLLGQSSQYAQTIANIKRPYLEQAKSSFENLPSDIANVFGKAKSEVSGLYDTLLSQTKDLITSEQAKQNLKLGALGLLNTQAQQWTTANILEETALPVLEKKTEALTKLTGAETDALLKYLFMKPDFYANIAEEMLSSDPYLLEQQYKMNIAGALMGVPTLVQPIYRQGLMRSLLPSIASAGFDLLKYLIK